MKKLLKECLKALKKPEVQNKVKEIMKPYIARLEDQKNAWISEASKLPSYEEFIKTNYYD